MASTNCFSNLFSSFSMCYAQTCTISGSPGTATFLNNVPDASLGRDTAFGTLLDDQSKHTTESGIISCTGSGDISYHEGFPTDPGQAVSVPGEVDGCMFNIPLTDGTPSGLGLAIYYDLDPISDTPSKQYCMKAMRYSSAGVAGKTEQGNFRLVIRVVGPLHSGVADLTKFNGSGIWWDQAQGIELWFDNININLTALSCDLNTPDIPVNLTPGGNINARTTFTGINSTSTPVDFNIELNCEQGTNVAIQFTGQTITGNQQALQLTSQANSASGLGIQILNQQGNAITFNPITPDIVANDVAKGIVNIPYKARYIQIEAQVNAGQADADANFTLTYP